MSTVKPEWCELQRETGRKCPKLFYNFLTNEEGYKLYFTDLILLWQAEASTEYIRDYAKITRTSIDPSDSAQLNVLLQKLTKSLAEGTNSLRQTEDAGTEAILLSTTLKLPRPLQPLKWDFYLEAKGAADLGEVVLRPCLHEASEGRKRVESLLEFIRAKDRVIAKLLEKIEGSSLDLSLVFPGITGVRANKGYVTLKEAQAHIPGLREFDLDQWRAAFASDSPYSAFESDGLYNLVTGNEKCPKHSSEQHQKWYSKLPRATATVSQAARIDAMKSSSPILNDTDMENEFETQKKRRNPAETKPDADSTDSDSEMDGNVNVNEERKTHAGSSKIPSSPPPVPRMDTIESMNDSDATASEGDDDLTILPKSKPRLAGLRSAKKPAMQTELSKVETSSNYRSSSPLPVRPVASSPLSSPPMRRPVLASQRLERSRQNRTESSSSRIQKAGRLGGLRKDSQVTETPEPGTAMNESTDKPPSTQTTPSRRRLGGLGRANTASQRASPSRNGSNIIDKMQVDEADDGQHSDASIASTASVSSSPPKSGIQSGDQEMDGKVKLEPENREPPPPQLTKEEKQSQRREELKRKHFTGQNAAVNNTGPAGGLRKKRKF